MLTRIHLETASATDPGIVRSYNEDSIAIEQELDLLVLADGMGGYKAGDVASSMATDLVANELKRTLSIHPIRKPGQLSECSLAVRSAIEKINRVIYRTAQSEEKYHGMGTTLALIQFHDNWATIAHVGDSRLYRWRNARFDLLTQDHSLLREQVQMGVISSDDARFSHNRNLVTRALGIEAEVTVEVSEIDVLPGDIYLLCSDGLNDMVDDADIELAVSELQANVPLAASQLVQMANDNGGHDNVSVLIAKVEDQTFPKRSWQSRFFGWLNIFER